jgi:hypothetical protein
MPAQEVDLFFAFSLGFLGSFGHCVGMCGNLALAFALIDRQPTLARKLRFHTLLNGGRALSYALVGSVLGGVGGLAGIGSGWRQAIAISTGILLVGLGLQQVMPSRKFSLPLLHPLVQKLWHDKLGQAMQAMAQRPLGLGLLWGLIPCGFLYTAQVKAVEMGSWQWGALLMLAFGAGTMPAMIASGVWLSKLGTDQRSQLYRLGGWLTIAMGLVTLTRSDAMYDFSGYAAFLCLWLAITARPLSKLLPWLLRYRRTLGVGALVLSIVHALMMIDHTLAWNLEAVRFLLPIHQWGIFFGATAVSLMLPAGITSFDRAQEVLGRWWYYLHLLAVPALGCSALHIVLAGSNFWGSLQDHPVPTGLSVGLLSFCGLGIFFRWQGFWRFFGVERYYSKPEFDRGRNKS